ncbi:hypothetical protein [Alkalihalophilus marmarensis]|uniref:hypothetical protein n=1 Tax=Alkalihalophilus marmarensis TaxID=521377 RepID=UPI002E244B59|nr:hypothetical protein [Alkalihalophilus marmarensis]
MQLANEQTFKKLSCYTSIEELNQSVKAHREANKGDLNKTMLEVLDILSRHSCVYLGVSYLRKSKIAEMIGKSKRTVIRVCNALEEMGIIQQHELKRVKGDKRQTSNAIVILPLDNEKEESDSPNCHTKEAPNKANKSNTRIRNAHESPNTINLDSDSSFLKQSLPSALYQTLKIFSAEEIYNLTGIIYRAKASIDRTIQIEDHSKDFTDTIRTVILKAKTSKLKNLNNYLYRSIQATTAAILRRSVSSQPHMSWLAGSAV